MCAVGAATGTKCIAESLDRPKITTRWGIGEGRRSWL